MPRLENEPVKKKKVANPAAIIANREAAMRAARRVLFDGGNPWVARPYHAGEQVIARQWEPIPDIEPEEVNERELEAEEVAVEAEQDELREQKERIEKAKRDMGRFETKVYQYLGIGAPKGLFGLEVEVEGENLPKEVKYFDAKRDGSLRGEGMEYVFEKPLGIKDSRLALDEFEKSLKGSKVNMSFRTSVHVHVNVSTLNKMQLCTFLYLAYLFENALVNYAGPTRIGNRFCLRIRDAYDKVAELEKLFQENGAHTYGQERGKYSAINLACLPNYGSVEFRCMRGTVDKKEITTWINILDHLYNTALKYKCPKDIADQFLEFDARTFAKQMLGDVYQDLNYPDLEEDLKLNFSLLISLPHEEIKDFV